MSTMLIGYGLRDADGWRDVIPQVFIFGIVHAIVNVFEVVSSSEHVKMLTTVPILKLASML